MDTIWKPLVGIPGYEASSYGHVRRTRKSKFPNVEARWPSGSILKGSIGDVGYIVLSFADKKVRLHRLIARTFLGPARGRHVNHIDGNKLNNAVSNLEYVTLAENAHKAAAMGLVHRGSKDGMAKLSEQDVLNIMRDLKNGMARKVVANKYSIGKGGLTSLLLGITWSWLTKIKYERQHPRTKLTPKDVREIRRLVASGTKYQRIKALYGIGYPAISSIIHFKTWRHVH